MADPERFDADPDPIFHADVDPDPNILAREKNFSFFEIINYFLPKSSKSKIFQNLSKNHRY